SVHSKAYGGGRPKCRVHSRRTLHKITSGYRRDNGIITEQGSRQVTDNAWGELPIWGVCRRNPKVGPLVSADMGSVETDRGGAQRPAVQHEMLTATSGEALVAPGAADNARVRIRDAAIESFAYEGFDVGMRAIAARAGVTAGLITHYYRSKAKLRQECDE